MSLTAVSPEPELPRGLTQAEAARRLTVDGPNALPSEGDRHWLPILGSRIASPLVLVLVVAALLARVLGERVEAVVILLIVGLNAPRVCPGASRRALPARPPRLPHAHGPSAP